jgi:hypothetical protein
VESRPEVVMVTTLRHGGLSVRISGGQRMEVSMCVCECVCAHEDSIVKPTKHCLKRGEEKGGLREDNGGLYLLNHTVYIKTARQWFTLVILITWEDSGSRPS